MPRRLIESAMSYAPEPLIKALIISSLSHSKAANEIAKMRERLREHNYALRLYRPVKEQSLSAKERHSGQTETKYNSLHLTSIMASQLYVQPGCRPAALKMWNVI